MRNVILDTDLPDLLQLVKSAKHTVQTAVTTLHSARDVSVQVQVSSSTVFCLEEPGAVTGVPETVQTVQRVALESATHARQDLDRLKRIRLFVAPVHSTVSSVTRLVTVFVNNVRLAFIVTTSLSSATRVAGTVRTVTTEVRHSATSVCLDMEQRISAGAPSALRTAPRVLSLGEESVMSVCPAMDRLKSTRICAARVRNIVSHVRKGTTRVTSVRVATGLMMLEQDAFIKTV